MQNAIHWFEIPCADIERANSFYSAILGAEMQVMDAMGMKTSFFPADLQNGVGGCLMQGPGYSPSNTGSIVYLNGGEDLSSALDKVEAAGGKIILPKTQIPNGGFMAHFTDTEGNRIGLYSRK